MASWIQCDCGNQIHTNLFAGAGVYLLVRDDEYDALPEEADRKALDQLFIAARKVLRCSKCGRLIIQWERGADYTTYVEEQPKADKPPTA